MSLTNSSATGAEPSHRFDGALVTNGLLLANATGQSVALNVDTNANLTANGAIAGNLYNVMAYGAKGDGSTDDTAAVKAAIAAAGQGVVFFPPGTFVISDVLTITTGFTALGSGMNSTIIKQTSTTKDVFAGTDVRYIDISDLKILGPGSGSGNGINLAFVASPTFNCLFENLWIASMGGDGMHLVQPCSSVLNNIRVQTCGRGFYLNAGTSLSVNGCYANGCTNEGWYLDTMTYCSLNGCAADSNSIGYYTKTSNAIAFNGCGAESQPVGFRVDSTSRVSLHAPFVTQITTTGYDVLSSSVVFAVHPRETNANGATASFKTASGTSALVIAPTFATAKNYAAGTVMELAAAGFVKVPIIANKTTSPYTATSSDYYVPVDATSGAFTLNLPAATGSGAMLIIEKVDSSANAVTVTRAGSDTINGASTVSLAAQWNSVTLLDRASASWTKLATT